MDWIQHFAGIEQHATYARTPIVVRQQLFEPRAVVLDQQLYGQTHTLAQGGRELRLATARLLDGT